MNFTYYEILDVPREADAATIKKAFRARSSKFHPDRNKDPDAADKMAMINKAYETLSNPERRKRYDETGQDSSMAEANELRDFYITVVTHALDENSDNLLEGIDRTVSKIRQGVREALAQKRAALKSYQQRQKKIKYKGSESDIIGLVLAAKISALTPEIQSAENVERMTGIVLKMLDDYESEELKRSPGQGSMDPYTGLMSIFQNPHR